MIVVFWKMYMYILNIEKNVKFIGILRDFLSLCICFEF